MEDKVITPNSASPLAVAAEDFRQARRRAAMQELTALLTGRSVDRLLSFEEVYQTLKPKMSPGQVLKKIPLAAIAGSVGRYTDFTRSFLPLRDSDESRWVGVEQAMIKSGGLPPIEVYQIDQVYFVLDGNHRVSVAHQLGMTHIEAYVSECKTTVPLSPDDQPDDLIVKAEYADFLKQTHLNEIRPEADLQVTVPGQYWELATHLEAHHFLLSQEQEGEISYEESIGNWYDNVYWPAVQDIQERGILRDFPGRTETDLYLWIFRHQHLLKKKLGWDINLEAAVTDLVTEHSPRPQRVVARVEEKLLHTLTPDKLEAGPAPGQWRRERLSVRQDDHLFADILVPVSGSEGGWYALELALEVARREDGQLFGLHVVSSAAQKESQAAQAVQIEFQQRCQEAGIPGELTIEVGDIVGKICERARWADLIVMYPANPPGTQLLSRLSSGSRNVIYRSCRPVLTVPGPPSPPERILLAYNGSPKAQEGLFVAAYLTGRWQVSLVVLAVSEQDSHTANLAQAQQYLAKRGVAASFRPAHGNVPAAILKTAAEQDSDLIIMGGYGAKPIREAVLGSKVNQVLRESRWPILVCR